jgi:tetratricopeptide (TPR) repeat protein
MNRAFALNPYPPPWYFSLHGTVLYVAHRYADAVAALKRVDNSLDPGEYVYLVASMGQLGRIEEAQRHAAQFRALYPETAIRQIVALEPFRDARDREHLLDGLRKVGAIE